jgi:hypothetical protein
MIRPVSALVFVLVFLATLPIFVLGFLFALARFSFLCGGKAFIAWANYQIGQ